jgi:sphingolipid delta-4 desaturase
MTHSLFLAIHEISHFLAFEKPNYNRYLATFANIPIGLPYWAAFRGYHMEHHTLQGTDSIDTDLPTRIEGVLFSSTMGKLFFCTFQILFYGIYVASYLRFSCSPNACSSSIIYFLAFI